MSDGSVPEGALDPETALARFDAQAEIRPGLDDTKMVPVDGFSNHAKIEEIVEPSGTRYEVTYLVREDTTTETELKPLDADVPPVEDQSPPAEFTEQTQSIVRDRERMTCEECDGDGVVSCYSCKGDGLVQCPRSNCRNGILKASCSCENGEISRDCGNCHRGRVTKTVYENGSAREKTEKCEICRGDGKLYETCSQCSGSGIETIGECSTCTQTEPVGKVDCTDCDAPDHTNTCRTCDGQGEVIRVVTERRDYTALEFENTVTEDFLSSNLEWEEEPATIYEKEGLYEIDAVRQPSRPVAKTRVTEYSPNTEQAYRIKYSVDVDHDMTPETSSVGSFFVDVNGDEVMSGTMPRKEVGTGLVGRLRLVLYGLLR